MSNSLILFFFLLISTTLPLNEGFTSHLIHRDSPNSPYHNPSLSKFDRLRSSAQRSISRAERFRSLASRSFDSKLVPNDFEYLMTIYIGTPPFMVVAIADTGSDLIWAQCKPCVSCYNQTDPMFDPKGSSTYTNISCKADICSALPESTCSHSSNCEYGYTYGDGSYTVGILSMETFTLGTPGSNGTASLPKILFGCSHVSNGTFEKADDGLVGLGGGTLSLVSQLGPTIDHKFSYCLLPYSDNTSSSLLTFGNDNFVSVGPNAFSTPIITRDGPESTFYFLSLEGFTVGNNSVLFPTSNQGNIIIDSGTTLTILDDRLAKPLLDMLTLVIKYPKVKVPMDIFEFCIDVSNATESDLDLPDVTFEFKDAPMKLAPVNTFVEVTDGVLCLAIVSSGGDDGISIFGNLGQQNFHLGYDLGTKRLSFAPADCSKF